jgi:hypothetical protein
MNGLLRWKRHWHRKHVNSELRNIFFSQWLRMFNVSRCSTRAHVILVLPGAGFLWKTHSHQGCSVLLKGNELRKKFTWTPVCACKSKMNNFPLVASPREAVFCVFTILLHELCFAESGRHKRMEVWLFWVCVCIYVYIYIYICVCMHEGWAIKSSPCIATFNDLLCFPFWLTLD